MRCGGTCPAGQKLCHSRCIPEGATCDGSCPKGTHDCNGTCASNVDVNSCGPTSCTPCAPPPGSTATCDGNACNFDCGTRKRCDSMCGECCTDADCPPKPGQIVTCDTATHTCHQSCPSGTRICNGICIPEGSCCTDGDCPAKQGQTAKCDTGTGSCGSSCTGDAKPCNGACIPVAGCCRDTDCPGSFACVANACSSSICRGGARKTAEDCTNGIDDDCDGQADCEDADCPTGHTCGQDRVCSAGHCTTCRPGAPCGNNPCKMGVTECSTGVEKCVQSNLRDGTTCNDSSCTGRMKILYQCKNGNCSPSPMTCPGQCNSDGSDCAPFDCQQGAQCGGPDTECQVFRLDCSGGVRSCKPSSRQDGTACGNKTKHCSGNKLVDGDTCKNGTCVPATTGRDCGFQCTDSMCIDTPPCNKITCFTDADADGFGDPKKPATACGTCPAGTVSNNKDCCDMDRRSSPNDVVEHESPNACGSFDHNCDGRVTLLFGKTETCDENCNIIALTLDSSSCGKPVCFHTQIMVDEISGLCLGCMCQSGATQNCD